MGRTSGGSGGGGGGGAMKLISSQVLAAPAASVTFSAIPATYNHLKLVCNVRTASAGATDIIGAYFNGDAAAHYDNLTILGNNVTVSMGTATGQTEAVLSSVAGNGATAGVSGISETDIPTYAGTTFFKTAVTVGGMDDSPTGAGDTAVNEILSKWRNTAAITSIEIFAVASAANFMTGSAFYMYGIT